MLEGNKFPLKRNPVIRFNKVTQNFDYSRKWIHNNNGFSKTYSSYDFIPRIRVVTNNENQYLHHSASDQTLIRHQKHGNGRKKSTHHSVTCPPKSAPPYISGSSTFEEQIPDVVKKQEPHEIRQTFFHLVKSSLVKK
jgi:hypothetical protein